MFETPAVFPRCDGMDCNNIPGLHRCAGTVVAAIISRLMNPSTHDLGHLKERGGRSPHGLETGRGRHVPPTSDPTHFR